MRSFLLPLVSLALFSSQVLAEACVIRSQGEQLDIKVCQQNRSIPPQLFRKGFCQPTLKGQTVEVAFVEQCPIGSFGACRNAKVAGTPYQQDIYYYGVASDARFLKPACQQQSQGTWVAY